MKAKNVLWHMQQDNHDNIHQFRKNKIQQNVTPLIIYVVLNLIF
jgi:hypothetical protein